jgi:hypothetical protein
MGASGAASGAADAASLELALSSMRAAALGAADAASLELALSSMRAAALGCGVRVRARASSTRVLTRA